MKEVCCRAYALGCRTQDLGPRRRMKVRFRASGITFWGWKLLVS